MLISTRCRVYFVGLNSIKDMESEADAPCVARVVVVGVAVAVHIAEVVGVARIRRTLKPIIRSP